MELSVAGGKKIVAPLYVQPGLADKTVVASQGMGRKNTGRVGCEAGFDSYPLLSIRILEFSVSELKPTGSYKILANTQEHWSMEGRAIIREANAEKYYKNQILPLKWVRNLTRLLFGVKTKIPILLSNPLRHQGVIHLTSTRSYLREI